MENKHLATSFFRKSIFRSVTVSMMQEIENAFFTEQKQVKTDLTVGQMILISDVCLFPVYITGLATLALEGKEDIEIKDYLGLIIAYGKENMPPAGVPQMDPELNNMSEFLVSISESILEKEAGEVCSVQDVLAASKNMQTEYYKTLPPLDLSKRYAVARYALIRGVLSFVNVHVLSAIAKECLIDDNPLLGDIFENFLIKSLESLYALIDLEDVEEPEISAAISKAVARAYFLSPEYRSDHTVLDTIIREVTALTGGDDTTENYKDVYGFDKNSQYALDLQDRVLKIYNSKSKQPENENADIRGASVG